MEVIRWERPLWTVLRQKLGDYGQAQEQDLLGDFWERPLAEAECRRLVALNRDPDIEYDVIETGASGVYPADECPPWEADPDRLRRRGYEIDP